MIGLLWLPLACLDPKPGTEDSAAAPASPTLAVVADHVVVEVGVEATLGAEASAGTVTWTFGDGETAEGASVRHAWVEPGNYTAVVELRAEDGRRLTAAVRAEVHLPRAVIPPVASAMLAVDDAGMAYAVTPEADTLVVVDGDGASRFLPTCAGPHSVAVDLTTVAVACGDGALWRWDRETLDPLTPIDLGADTHAWGVVAWEGGWIVALAGTGKVVRVAADGGLSRIPVGPDPRAVAVTPDGQILVARFRSAAEGGEVYRVDGATLSLPVHTGPDSDTVTGGVPTLIETLALSPDGATLYLPVAQANVGRGLLTTGAALTFETTVRAALGVTPVDAVAEDWQDRKIFDNQDRAVAVAPSPTGNHVAVAHPGTGVVQILDAYTVDIVGSLPAAGSGLRGLVWTERGLLVFAWLDRTVSLWALGEPGALPTLVWSAPAVDVEPLDAEVLLGKRLFHTAADPRISKDGYIACASCHPDGAHDGLTWDFTSRGEGLRNTASLEGRAGTGMGFLHWSANFDEVQDFENDIRNAFGGTGLLSDADWAATSDTLGAAKAGRSADLDALAAYVTRLATTPASPWAADADEAGARLFAESGCDTCHVPPLYTDSALGEVRLHDVGTLTAASGERLGGSLDGLDTPTLLGAWETAPYLHDGSAPDLEAAIRAHATLTLDADTVVTLARWVRGL